MAGGAQMNDLSYQLARQFAVPVQGVYLNESAGMFKFDQIESGWIILSLNAIDTPDLNAFIKAFKDLEDGDHVPVAYYSIADSHTKNVAVVTVEKHWSSFKLAIRNDKTGVWDMTDLNSQTSLKNFKPLTVCFPELDSSLGHPRNVFYSLVKVSMHIPFKIEGFPKSRRQGAGLILDSKKGFVICSRSIIPFSLGDVNLTVADSVIVPAKVSFLHPTQNYAILSYDPSLLGETKVCSLVPSNEELKQGRKTYLVGYSRGQQPICVETTVTEVHHFPIPANVTPRFRAINFDSIKLDTPLSQICPSGALSDSQGRVQGLWLNFLGEQNANGKDIEYHTGIHIQQVIPILQKLQNNINPLLRGLAIEVSTMSIAQAMQMGVSSDWVKKIEDANPSKRQLFYVRHVESESPTSKVLEDLDLILSIDGKPVSKMTDFDLTDSCLDSFDMIIVRNKKELHVTVPSSILDGECTKRIVCWAGAILHGIFTLQNEFMISLAPHRAVKQQSHSLLSGIYVSCRSKGSPSYMYGLGPTQWITHVNGVKTVDLDDFLAQVKKCKDGEYVRLKTVSFDGIPCVVSIKICNHYWPTMELIKDPGSLNGWKTVKL